MLRCPVPPADQWDASLRARMNLLRAKGLPPRLLLPGTDTPVQPQDSNSLWGLARGRRRRTSTGLALHPDAWATLETLVMEPSQVIIPGSLSFHGLLRISLDFRTVTGAPLMPRKSRRMLIASLVLFYLQKKDITASRYYVLKSCIDACQICPADAPFH